MSKMPTAYHTVALPFAVLSLLLALGFLRFTAGIETDELRHRLNSLTLRAESVDASDILIRLEEELKNNTQRPEKKQIPEEELRLLTAFPERASGDTVWLSAESLPVKFFRSLITLMQRAAGVRPVQHIYLDDELDLVTLAYNLERRRYYAEALVTFQKALKPHVSPATRDFIRLHSGFDFFFLAEYESARNAWKDVAAAPASEANRVLAEKLIAWFDRFMARRDKTQLLPDKKARALGFYRIMAYKDALESLTQVAENERDQNYYYLRGRAHEAPGEYQAAVEDYRKSIAKNRQSDVAALAHRRLFLMGALYRRNDRLAEAAKTGGTALGDAPFFAAAAPYVGNPTPVKGAKSEKDYVPEEAYQDLIRAAGEKITEKPEPVKKKYLRVRIKTVNGSVITGRQLGATAELVIVENENGRFRIPTDDIESKEIVSGN
ncbi:MAG: hypothetical protein KF713_19230 [Turneriella sp.]|nr:hypothetical protein [Turneriella sp.]